MKRLILILSLLCASIVYAEEQKTYNFWWETIPAVCSTSDEIQRWANDKNMVPVNVSVGKENGSPDGKIVYIVIYWINDTGETFASVSTPDDPGNAYIVFRTFDLRINSGLQKPGS